MSVTTVAVERLARPMRRVLQHDFLGHAALVFASQLALNFFNYLFHFAVSRRLGADGYGTLQSLLAITTILSVPSGIVSLVVVKAVSELTALGDAGKVRWLVKRLTLWTAAAALAMLVLMLAFSGSLAAYFRVDGARVFSVTGIFVALYVILPVMRSVLQGLQRFQAFSISIVLEGVGKAGLGIGLAYAGFGVAGVFAGIAVAAGIALVYTLLAVRAKMDAVPLPFRLDIRHLAQSGGGAAIATLASAVLLSVDMLMVKHFFPAHEAGIYAAAALVGRVLLFVVGFIPVVVLPKVTAMATHGRSPRKLLGLSVGLTLTISGCGLAVLAFRPELVLSIMAGRAFLGAAPLLVYYGIAMTLLGLINLATTYKIGIHRMDFAAPLLIVVFAEVAAMQIFHSSLMDIIKILIVGHAVAAGVCFYRIAAPVAPSSLTLNEKAA